MTTPEGDAAATEDSPLLANDFSKPIDGSLGTLPNGTAEIGTASRLDQAGGERGGTDEDAGHNFEGIPELIALLPWLLPAVGIGIFLSAADQTIIVSSYGRIGSELQALNSTSWIATSYFLTLTSFQPLYGKLTDIFGRKAPLLWGYALFGLGCLFCGLARNIGELIAARAFAGIGGGGMTVCVSIIMSDIIPLRNRGTWQGYINIIFAMGAATGAPLGGILSDSIGWRWAFLAQAPMCAIAFVAVYIILNLPERDSSNWRERVAQIDFLGALSLIVATTSLLIGLDHGSNISWNNLMTIIPVVAAFPLFAIFVFVELKIASNPFAPGRIIFERSMLAAYLCNFFALGSYMALLFYIPLYFQAVMGLSSTEAGLRLIPSICCSVTGSIGGGLIMKKTGKYYWLTIVSYTLILIGLVPILLCSGGLVNSDIGIIFGLCLGALGGGSGVVSSLIALISNAATADQAVATACSYLFRSLGSVVGLSLSATVVQQTLRTQLHSRLQSGGNADQIVDHVRQSLDYIKVLPPQVREVVRSCYARSVQSAFLLSGVVVFGAIISACFIREKKLSK